MKQTIYRNNSIFTGLWAFIILILCATPGQYIPSSTWLDLLSIDKLVHATMFFVLSALFLVSVFKYEQSYLRAVVYISISILYGISLEWMHATLFINRSADWHDIVANTIGCLLALVFYKRLKNFFAESNKKTQV